MGAKAEAWHVLAARKLHREWLSLRLGKPQVNFPAWPLPSQLPNFSGPQFPPLSRQDTSKSTSLTYCDIKCDNVLEKGCLAQLLAQNSVQLMMTMIWSHYRGESFHGTVGWFARPPLWPFCHWRSLTNDNQLAAIKGLKDGGWRNRIQAMTWN